MSNPSRHTDLARAWVEIDLGALRANYRTLRERVGPGPGIMVMVKADGYGLGARRVVRALEPMEPWGYGVATAEEGAELRAVGVRRPILVISPPGAAAERAAAAGLTAGISDLEGLAVWSAAAERHGSLDFHVEVDTGMGRTGFDWREAGEWGHAVADRAAESRLRWTGVYTHFQGADLPDPAPSARQWERFRGALVKLPVPSAELVVHACNSAAALRWPEYALDLVRAGIFLYGGHPAPEAPDPIPAPVPVAALRARLILVREVPAGTTVGYGATYTATRRERWGTLGVGYGDGLPRAVTGRARVLVRGRFVPLLGRVSMDLVVVDLTEVPQAAVGDVVTFIGRDGAEEISLEDVAAQAGTIGYEILTGLGPRLPRVERADREGDVGA